MSGKDPRQVAGRQQGQGVGVARLVDVLQGHILQTRGVPAEDIAAKEEENKRFFYIISVSFIKFVGIVPPRFFSKPGQKYI